MIGEQERGDFNGFHLEMTAHEDIVDLIIVLGLLRNAGVRGIGINGLVGIYLEGILQQLKNGQRRQLQAVL